MNRFQKLGCKSSVNLVVIEHHISIWLIEDCCTLTAYPPQGVPTEDAAMLNVNELSGSWTPCSQKNYVNLSNLLCS